MIDIHSHILPGIDDGARTMEDALEMAKTAVNEGITAICATPHHRNGRFENERTFIDKEVKHFKKELEICGIPLEVINGQEVRLYSELINDLEQNLLMPINNQNYLLVEFPSSSVPKYAADVFYELNLREYIPIIVHPERNSEIIEKPELLHKFIEAGALTQVTANSIIGNFGKKIMDFSFDLLKAKMVHVIASDAHNVSSRGFHLVEAYESIQKDFGIDYRCFLQENAELILNGGTVFIEKPSHIKKKKFLGIF
jgi:protein-tyrosine phosphatase